MKLVLNNDVLAVIDDFLELSAFEKIWNFIQTEKFKFVHSSRWVNAFSLEDGSPLWGGVTISHPRPEPCTTEQIYPTNTTIDLFIKELIAGSADYSHLIGSKDRDWDFFYARPYLYPRGSGLSWHTDGKFKISGAYVYYCHPVWDLNWGAELLINPTRQLNFEYSEVTLINNTKKKVGFHLNSTELNNYVGDGIGYYVVPKPNRLVIFKNNILHCIKKVENAAGNHVRASITGFFMSNDRIDEAKETEKEHSIL
ncbi:TPA: 2OG-Fe(II) oxygenase [Legionella pneumophila]|uniref:Proline hydroxylase n=1 Tax=Legionella pneumophila TaxID=446 RepID=A0A2S6EV13_LEGPN|nr:2OG-Fe(II) oxygenase [Legionella pneumophila]APF04294.1 proline hydroxylase [Legionella pneumophila subsp. fraseri]APF07276.1 proline hydroxylase [Legionella pneumophila subsp. fraseri]AUB69733.1 proline hydroxylase [Legionella pneumophila]AUB72708.1 proline hydroxylase [Legionella pneumophila]KXB25705.1 proline hydroxylase [Legionella pneumophila]